MQVQGCCNIQGNKRPQLFNWVTVIFLVVWVGIVAVIAELTPVSQANEADVDSFIRTKVLNTSSAKIEWR